MYYKINSSLRWVTDSKNVMFLPILVLVFIVISIDDDWKKDTLNQNKLCQMNKAEQPSLNYTIHVSMNIDLHKNCKRSQIFC